MELKSVSGLIYYVSDVQKSVAFYESLGFRQNNLKATQPRVYLNWFSIEFRQRSDASQISGHGQETCIKVDDIDASYEACKKLGCRITAVPHKSSDGSYAYSLSDPDGYILTFFAK